MTKTILWIAALVVGAVLGLLGLHWLDQTMEFVAVVYTRLFQLLAVPTIVLAVITTFATFGAQGSGRIFGHTLTYTLLTTFAAAAVGAGLYVLVAPGNLPAEAIGQGGEAVADTPQLSYYSHLISLIPNNIVKPFLEGNVLSLLLLAFAIGIGLSKLPESENKAVVVKGLLGLQELLFLIYGCKPEFIQILHISARHTYCLFPPASFLFPAIPQRSPGSAPFLPTGCN